MAGKSDQAGKIPRPSRPHIPGYGIPKTVEGTLPWSHVVNRMLSALELLGWHHRSAGTAARNPDLGRVGG